MWQHAQNQTSIDTDSDGSLDRVTWQDVDGCAASSLTGARWEAALTVVVGGCCSGTDMTGGRVSDGAVGGTAGTGGCKPGNNEAGFTEGSRQQSTRK